MKLGRNIKEEDNRYYLVVTWSGETKHVKVGFDTYRKAKLRMTKYLNEGADWFGVYEDPTI